MQLETLSSVFLFILPPLLFFFFFFIINNNNNNNKNAKSSSSTTINLPKSYPIIGMAPAIYANRDRRFQWLTEILIGSPSRTFTLHRPLGKRHVFTSNPSNVQHILKTKFHIYIKGDFSKTASSDFLGNGIFNVDGESWKFQRQVSIHEFNTRSLRKFIQIAVGTELSDRLIPILSAAATADGAVLDFQDILQRFAFDNVCKIAFDCDPEYLTPSLPQTRFAEAFEDCARLTSKRFNEILPIVWKIKRFLSIGSEKNLKHSVSEVRQFAKNVIRAKKTELENKNSTESYDLLSRFLSSGHSDEDFVTDIVISFILAGRDTTSAALTWFFWLISRNPEVEDEILKEIGGKSESMKFDEVKDMPYTHASLCESMRLYPPVPVDTKEAIEDDVLPDGTVVKKGMRVAYHPYAMGRSEELWGSDWPEFKPERWLERGGDGAGKWRFVGKDAYTYPVFQAGPRICLGKEMAFLQMKSVVAGVLGRFRIVPVVAKDGSEPEFISFITSKMKGGFPVRIEERVEKL